MTWRCGHPAACRKWPFRECFTSRVGLAEPGGRARKPVLPRAAASSQPRGATASVSYGGFLALLDNLTMVPPDGNGAASPRYVVTTLNTQVTIQSRNGAVRTNFPITLNAFWSPLGSFADTFDPRVLYDAAADRWLVSTAVKGETSTSALLLGVSQSGDPGGNWNLFRIDIGGTNWGDYPVLGFNGAGPDLIGMVPSAFRRPELIVTMIGLLEILGAVGLLFPATASAAAVCLAWVVDRDVSGERARRASGFDDRRQDGNRIAAPNFPADRVHRDVADRGATDSRERGSAQRSGC